MDGQSLTIVRGVPGAGKSEFANFLALGKDKVVVLSSDNYFIDPKTKEYKFDAKKLAANHERCFQEAFSYLEAGYSVIVANTFTKETEVAPYKELAAQFKCRFNSIIVEHRHTGQNIHNVPEETIEAMRRRFSIVLR